MKPFLKWVGSKKQVLPKLVSSSPKSYGTYYEPFIGSGALLFALRPRKAVINDLNWELANCYKAIKSNAISLLVEVAKHTSNYSEDYYYAVRAWDRQEIYNSLPEIKKAGRTLFLNKTCYSGLYRVNKKGYFNVPFGHYKSPRVLDTSNLWLIEQYLRKPQIQIKNEDFETCLKSASKGDFIYLDPPYDFEDKPSFTSYNRTKFDRDAQHRVRRVFDDLTHRGCYVLLSNSSTEFIKELYKDYKQEILGVERIVNIKSRKPAQELLIKNY